MNRGNSFVNTAYESRENFILIGLTGRTGSGCSTIAKILEKEKFSDLGLPRPQEIGNRDIEERKYAIQYHFMEQNDKWKQFKVIRGSNMILSFILEEGLQATKNYIKSLES